MRSRSDSVLIVLENLGIDLGVMQQPQGTVNRVSTSKHKPLPRRKIKEHLLVTLMSEVIKPALLNSQSHSDSPHNFNMQPLTLLKEPQHDPPKLRPLLIKNIRPFILKPFDSFPPNL